MRQSKLLFNTSVFALFDSMALLGVHPRLDGSTVDDQTNQITNLDQRLQDTITQYEVMLATAAAEERDLSETELSQVKDLKNSAESIREQIEARNGLRDVRSFSSNAPVASRSEPAPAIASPVNQAGLPGAQQNAQPAASTPSNAQQNASQGKNSQGPQFPFNPGLNGFQTAGHFFEAVRNAAINPTGNYEPRLSYTPSNAQQNAVGADGGFLIPPDISREVWKKVFAENPLISRCALRTTTRDRVTDFVNPEEPWKPTGVVAQVVKERGKISASNLKFEELDTRLYKLAALMVMSNEQMNDTAEMESAAREAAPAAIMDLLERLILSGSGQGEPQGLFNSGGTVIVPKEIGQASSTYNYQNMIKQHNAIFSQCRQNMIWIHNQDLEPEFDLMSFPGDGSPVYLPNGSANNPAIPLLKGHSAVPHHHTSIKGMEGDIIAADLSKYRLAMQTNGPTESFSAHLLFDTDESVFKWIFRVGGQPLMNSPVELPNSNQPRSAFAVVAERA